MLYRSTVELLTDNGEVVTIQEDMCRQQIGDITAAAFPAPVVVDVHIVDNTVVSRKFSYDID